MGNYLKKYLQSVRQTPQTAPIPGANQVMNNAGGYVFALDAWAQLDRFLILGTEGGSYYATEQKMTADNAKNVIHCIQTDGQRVVQRVTAISQSGRAPKNEPAIFALALCFAFGDADTKRAASEALPTVCRIGTHLLHFAEYVNGMRGWGRGLRRAVGTWYTGQTARDVAFQVAKYQARDGWSHRDLLRLAHPTAPTEDHNLIFSWVVDGWPAVGDAPHPVEAMQVIWAMERAKTADKALVLKLIADYRLQREMIPTQFLTDPDVWAALLPNLGLTAVLRNLGNLSKSGLLVDGNMDVVNFVCKLITNGEALKKARVHPIAALNALLTYKQGHGVRGSSVWPVVTKVVDALDAAFYKAFGAVEASGKRTLLALDVSGSMGMGTLAGVPALTPRVGSGAMALVTAATETDYTVMAFSDKFVPINISPRQRLDDVINSISNLPFSGTDCALPMLWALENKAQIDTFVVYTDNETWAGNIHPVQALRQYREKTSIPAKLIVVGMTATNFTIADPADAGMMDVVGFDTAAPQLMADFARGQIGALA
jgi:60 kDa SS-A/Ro ribonucleoprotein